jgi:hypothetical protein
MPAAKAPTRSYPSEAHGSWAMGKRRACFARKRLFLGLLAFAFAPSIVYASDQDAVRIAAAGHSLKWNWTPPGRSDRYGHGETLVHAPLSVVRARVVDYGHYKDFMPTSSRPRVSLVTAQMDRRTFTFRS